MYVDVDNVITLGTISLLLTLFFLFFYYRKFEHTLWKRTVYFYKILCVRVGLSNTRVRLLLVFKWKIRYSLSGKECQGGIKT